MLFSDINLDTITNIRAYMEGDGETKENSSTDRRRG